MKRRIFLIPVFFLLFSIAANAQCAMCRAVAQSGSSNGQNLANGLNPAIIYLMIAPYVLLILFFRKKIWSFLKELRGLWS